MRRVVITGQGSVNALGFNVRETFDAFKAGKCGIGALEFKNADRLSIKIGGQIKGYEPERHFNRKELALYDRYTQLTLLATQEALEQSGLVFDNELAQKSGVILGTAGGGMETQDESYRQVYEERKNKVHPFVVPKLMNNAATSHVSILHNIQGPCFTVSTACASSNHAMGQALQFIRAGLCDAMISGGSECMLCFGGVKAWEGLRVMSKDACRPFSLNRSGMVQGEGATVYVFEEYEHARKRGADILAEVIGFSMGSDAHDIVVPSRQGAARTISAGLRDAQVSPDSVGYLNAHGTGTVLNDKTECAAIRDVFGSHADRLMVSSTKSMHGHLIGGTGALEMLSCVMALREGVVAPTIGYQIPDPECALDIVPNDARDANIEVALSNSFAFGGLNAVIVLRKI